MTEYKYKNEGAKFKSLLDERNLTPIMINALCGYNFANVYDLINGKTSVRNMKVKNLISVCKVLEMNVQDFLQTVLD